MRDYSVLEGIKCNQNNEIDTAYNKGYNAGYASGLKDVNDYYNKGIDAGWDLAKRIMNLPIKDRQAIFHLSNSNACFTDVAKKYTPSEALELIEKYPIEIKVGDEVETFGGCRGIVTNTDTHYHIFFPENGKTWKVKKSNMEWLTKVDEDKRMYGRNGVKIGGDQ